MPVSDQLLYLVVNVTCIIPHQSLQNSAIIFRDVFRTKSKIYDGAFSAKIVKKC